MGGDAEVLRNLRQREQLATTAPEMARALTDALIDAARTELP